MKEEQMHSMQMQLVFPRRNENNRGNHEHIIHEKETKVDQWILTDWNLKKRNEGKNKPQDPGKKLPRKSTWRKTEDSNTGCQNE
jgi:hypothetical protein